MSIELIEFEIVPDELGLTPDAKHSLELSFTDYFQQAAKWKAQAAAIDSDIVIVAAKSDPPVARILDLGKHMYEKRKKHAKQKSSSRGGEIKGVRIGFQMGEHDTNIRLKQAAEFLEEGHKVKLEIRLRGREKGRLSVAEKIMQDFITAIPGGAKREDTISKSPRGLNVLLTR